MQEVSFAKHPEVCRTRHVDLEEGQQATPQLQQTKAQGYDNNRGEEDDEYGDDDEEEEEEEEDEE